MKIVVLEDEFYAADKLKKELSKLNSKIEIVATLESCEEALNFFKSNHDFDLVMSDIHLADGLCFGIFEEIDIKTPIIFTTAYDKYALQAFEVHGIDYLLKPIQSERLQAALDKYHSLKETQQDSHIYKQVQELMLTHQKQFKTRFLCKLGNKIKSIPTESILFFYSKDKMSFIVDESHDRYPVNHTLDEIDSMIDPNQFFRLNRQVVTNFHAIDEIHPHFKGRLKIKLRAGKYQSDLSEIVVSTDRSPLLKAWLDK